MRVSTQYSAVRELKEKLPQKHVVVQMDFAENYSCKTNEEVQRAYWNSQIVTLHPSVVYFTGEEGKLNHKSFVFVSDESSHTAPTVLTFLDVLVTEIKKLVPDLQQVHYLSDSPTSQYINKTIFSFVADHETLHGCQASWTYFEAGHGKGPCDGVGGTVKRMADQAVTNSNASIQDAADFFAWSKTLSSAIDFHCVTTADCADKKNAVQEQSSSISTTKGTMLIHQVVGVAKGLVKVRQTSCFCNECFAV